ncbi:putative FRE ferric reductase-like transmembrane component [Annulohypoxylon truncatum]|uniref:putative FRE ferric reductase-like transmembrane component n=1 Tax=Annulohypoxylon truncatum TaxID=327061 RepID=UPI0020081F02|nr:putative FRE ferric reductase-like transmembrane component [Annulohypoxylon truncatum]KAI1205202.1 putative FRE ferric reductase-like transmembrane component [Annulohypoxylon truncatum]
MDMEMTGTPWLNQPVMLHSSRADSCSKFTAAQCAYRNYRWRYWYQADHVFALSTVYFFIAVIGVCFIGFCSQRFAPASLREKAWWRKLVASIRFLAYRRYDAAATRWRMPSLGVSLLMITGAVFFLAMTLGPQPYYWPNTQTLNYGSSPPIATRTGWMALACLPFMIILPTKANMIASLTGVSHERLIVFHNWVGWAMFALALVHTFPFIVFHIWKGDMVNQWDTSVVYWTGVVAIIAQAYLQVFSLRFIRDRFYEFFKATHYIAAIVFVVFFFIHCDFRLSSWDYFIATGVLYTLSFLYPQIRTYFEFGLSHRASFTMVSDLTLKVTIPIDTAWRPGQHMFLRFVHMGLHAFTAHPFTICSLPVTRDSKGNSKLTFYVHPRSGLTARLAQNAVKQPGFSVPVLLDGPYGGVQGRPLYTYDHNLIVACGAGAGLSLPFVMESLLRSAWQARSGNKKFVNKIQVVIATRDMQLVHWYEEALLEYLEENGLEMVPENLDISIYQTGRPESKSNSTSKDPERPEEKLNGNSQTVSRLPISVFSGRPDITTIVRDATLQPGHAVGIVACGPGEVLKIVHDEAAEAQLRVMSSKASAREVYLHSEVFSW